ncbi:unnamed protein product, partial [Amoebophrya sp. A25]
EEAGHQERTTRTTVEEQDVEQQNEGQVEKSSSPPHSAAQLQSSFVGIKVAADAAEQQDGGQLGTTGAQLSTTAKKGTSGTLSKTASASSSAEGFSTSRTASSISSSSSDDGSTHSEGRRNKQGKIAASPRKNSLKELVQKKVLTPRQQLSNAGRGDSLGEREVVAAAASVSKDTTSPSTASPGQEPSTASPRGDSASNPGAAAPSSSGSPDSTPSSSSEGQKPPPGGTEGAGAED